MFSWLIVLLFHCHAETDFLLESYLSHSSNVVSDTILNPGNVIFNLPSESYNGDVRAELKWKNEVSRIIVRPRYTAEKKTAIASGVQTEKTESHWDITDAFIERYVTPELGVTAGLQVYQWGPAELASPSDPLYHFNSRQKSYGYKEKGKVLLRLNYSLSRTQNLVFLAEPVSNNEAEWIAGESFSPKALVKYEIQNEDSTASLGLVAGREERKTNFAGGYFTVPIAEGFSFYSDFKTAEEQVNFIAVQNGLFTDLVEPSEKKKWPVLSVTGFRWEGSADIRLEYVYNSAGFTSEELKSVFASVSVPLNPNYLQNLQRFEKPGLELLGQQYMYFSYRVTEPFDSKDLNFYLRDLYSLQDYSSQTQAEFDKAVSDHFVIFGNLTAASGHKDTEFELLNDWQTLIGMKWVL
jgi:hypothetical protein